MFDLILLLITILALILLFVFAKIKRRNILQPKFKIIGITGLKFNGKDTIANYLCHKYGFNRIAFADPLKEACKILFGFNDEQLYGSLKETPDKYWFGLTPRSILQFIGTDLFRNLMKELHQELKDDFWLLCMNKSNILKEGKYIVISDVRFPNECEMIKKLGGIIIRVNRPSVNTKIDLHNSEKLILTLDVDYEIQNNNSIQELNKKVDQILFDIEI